MTKMVMSKTRFAAYRMLMWPIAATIVLGVILGIITGPIAAYSAGLGGAVWVLPNLYFASRLLTDNNLLSAKHAVWTLYRAEVIKLALSAMLFVIVIKFLAVTVLAVLAAYITAQVTFWLTILFYLGSRTR